MLRILTASSILALTAVPAIAQQAGPMATPATPEASTDAVAPAPAAEPAPVTEPAPAPAAESRAATVTKLVDAEFPAYDANQNGELDEPEFSKWLLALHAAGGDASSKAMDDAAKAKWAKDGFAAADTDKNQKVSKAEMNKFLAG
jgi:hypothetical protein